jgi:hypothetical protein
MDPRDSALLLRMKNRQIKIMPEAIAEAFPKMWESWGRKTAQPVVVQEAPVVQVPTFQAENGEAPVKRGRGRPKGSTKKEVA